MAPRPMILGTAGHIDHGKTALVRALTGIDTDRLAEEKQRGITIDLGFAHLELAASGHRLGIVDVPGHERFIKNMLAGAAGIDLALLVVAADDSVMPQTREHLAILELLDVRHGVIAITKADLAEPGWLELVEQEARDLVAGTFLEGAAIVPTSASERTGLDELRGAIAAACDGVRRPDDDAPFRLCVDRAFTRAGMGTVVTGTVSSGTLAAGAEVDWLPAGRSLRVRGVQTHGAEADRVGCGQRAALNLVGVHHTEIERGHVLAAPGFLASADRLSVHLDLLPGSPWPLKHRARVRVYLGTQEVIATVALLEGTRVDPGGGALAQLHCAEPVAAVGGQPFVLRAESPLWTIGGGRVLQPSASHIARRQARHLEQLCRLASGELPERAGAAVFFRGAHAASEKALCRDVNVDGEQARRLLGALDQKGITVRLHGGVRLHRDVLDEIAARLMKLLGELHAAAPLEALVPTATLVQRLHLDRAVVSAVASHLVEQGVLVAGEHGVGAVAGVALAGHAPQLTQAQQRLHELVLQRYRAAGLTPPALGELEEPEEQVRPIVELCVDQGDLVRLADGLYLHRDNEADVRRLLEGAMAPDAGLTVSEIKEVLGVSRKYAVPICEHLDRVGFTKRVDDVRVLAQGG